MKDKWNCRSPFIRQAHGKMCLELRPGPCYQGDCDIQPISSCPQGLSENNSVVIISLRKEQQINVSVKACKTLP